MDWVDRLENHWLACVASLGGGGRLTRLAGAVAVTNPRVSHPIVNFISLRRCPAAGLAHALSMGEALLSGAGSAPTLLLTPAAGDVAALGSGLIRLGWYRQTRQVVLRRSLPGPQLPAAPILVKRVPLQAASTWQGVLAEAYEAAPGVGEEVAAAYGSLAAAPGEASEARLYMAYIADRPVGTGLSWYHGGLAALYAGAVLPSYRRRGAERSLLLQRLEDATAAGMTDAFLQTEAGSPVANLCLGHLGFQTAYERELWLPKGNGPIIVGNP